MCTYMFRCLYSKSKFIQKKLFKKKFFGKDVRIIYVESAARVKTLSLTGKILYLIADRFFVQWPKLLEKYKYAEYIGRLC